jgi:hypothetical protein
VPPILRRRSAPAHVNDEVGRRIFMLDPEAAAEAMAEKSIRKFKEALAKTN